MKKIYMTIFVILLTLVFANTSFAQGAAKKIAFMDLSKIFDGYQRTKEYDAALESQHKGYETERNAKLEKLKEAQGKVALLKEEEKGKAEADIEQMRTDLLAFDQAKRTDLTKQRDEKIREILLEIEKIVSDYAKKEGYDFILNDRVLIYGNETLDISDQILKLINESYNKK